ncbi:MAG: patatin-like phospholipase family protein [Acidobacteriota bacterium]|nr:patatin-like phospholipase family protein [Acidobacteriota bacterium]
MSTTFSRCKWFACALCIALALAAFPGLAQTAPTPGATPQQEAGKQESKGSVGGKNAGASDKAPAAEPSTSASKPSHEGEATASTTKLRLGPIDPGPPPAHRPIGRPTIGLALGGGGALAMSEIGVLAWFEQHHVPVDMIAGTSMGSIVGALYSTGSTPDQMTHIMTDESVNTIFRIDTAYKSRSFRRREDSREIPNGITLGLKHGVSLRNSLLTDSGFNALLDREFLRYNDQTDFNNLPIPFRCVATDLNAARSVTFARGSIPDAVRASASLPGIFRPFTLDGHDYVDGAVLANLPTQALRDMKPDVVLAVSLPLLPVAKGELDSIVGVLQRAFAVAIEGNEQRSRKAADLVLVPNLDGFNESDYLKTEQLAARGYNVAEANKDALLKYAVTPEQWDEYIAGRRGRERGPAGTILRVKVKAPNPGVEEAAHRKFDALVDQPFDENNVDSLLADLRSDGRYDADYSIGYDSPQATRPILLVNVDDKKNGPPFLEVGANIAAQTGGVTRATVEGILLDQDLGGYGSELRTIIKVGFLTEVESEYYRKLNWSGFFAAPRANITRQPYYIYSGDRRLSERQSQMAGGGGDIGWSDGRMQELRAGWLYQNVQWHTTTGFDNLPDYAGSSQRVRVKYIFDSQDRALVPQFGLRLTSEAAYLYNTPGSPSAPQLFTQLTVAHTFAKKNIALVNMEGATMFNRNVAQPFRYTLGGPLRLSAASIDQYRGTDYFLITPGYLRRIASLPRPLGQSIFVGATYEVGQMRAPDNRTITRQDVYFGIVAETPLGVITFAPSFGDGGNRKLNFTLGRLF